MTFRELVTKIGFKVDTTQLKKADRALGEFQKNSQKKLEHLKRGADSIAGAGKKLTLGLTTPLIALGTVMTKTASDMEVLEAKFSSLLGGDAPAQKKIEELTKTATDVGLLAKPFREMGGQMLAMGIPADKLADTMVRLGKVTNGEVEAMKGVAFQYAQIRTKTKPELEDLKSIAERGVPIFDMLARSMGVSVKKVFEMSAEGELRFKHVEKAIMDATNAGGRFADTLDKKAQTLSGRINKLRNRWEEVSLQFGKILLPVAEKVVTVLEKILMFFEAMPQPMKKVVVGFAAILAALGPILIMVGTVAGAVLNLIGLFGSGGALIGALAALKTFIVATVAPALMALLSNPVGWIILLIALFAKLGWEIAKWVNGQEGWLSAVFGTWESFVNGIKNLFSTLVMAFKRDFGWVLDTLKQAAKIMWNLFKWGTGLGLGMWIGEKLVGMGKTSASQKSSTVNNSSQNKVEVKVDNNFTAGTDQADVDRVNNSTKKAVEQGIEQMLNGVDTQLVGA